jgi:hypothetical protein
VEGRRERRKKNESKMRSVTLSTSNTIMLIPVFTLHHMDFWLDPVSSIYSATTVIQTLC